jgi:hypothetical protein
MTSALDQLHKKARRLAERRLATTEEIITVIPGRSKQAMIVTDRQILIVKPGLMSGAWLGPKAASFPLTAITTINVHTGRGVAALEVVVAGSQPRGKADLITAFQLPNWLPCHASVGGSPMIRELRAYVQSGGRSRSARAELRAHALSGPQSR